MHVCSFASKGLPAVLVVGLALAGCGGGGSSVSTTGTPPTAQSPLVAGGVLKVGAELDIPPDVYLPAGQAKKPVGAEVDLLAALGKRLGFTTEYVNIAFDGLIPAFKADRFDVTMSQLGDFTDRQKQVDFVDYAKIGMGVVSRAADKAAHPDATSFCGGSLGGAKGTVAVKLADDAAAACKAAGKPTLKVSVFPDDNAALLALRSGRIAGHVIDMHSAAVVAKDVGGGKALSIAVPNLTSGIPLGIAVPKARSRLRDGLARELQVLISDGTYQRILDKWGIASAAIPRATVNGGTQSGT